MYLVVDAGNSFVKVGIFSGDKLILRVRSTYDLLPSVGRQIRALDYEKGIVISVAYELNGYLLRFFPKAHLLIPAEVSVPTRYSLTTLGPDRLAATYPFISRKESAIVVVCGTAVTVNVVKDGVFLGGPIFPSFRKLRSAYFSLSMMGRKLHPDSLRAIDEGIKYAVLGGVREVIRDMERRYGIRKKYLTGGCAHAMKVGGKVIPDLVLLGGKMLLQSL